MQPNNQDPYDFIMDSSQKKPSGPAVLQDSKKRIIVAVLFVVAVLLIIVIAFFVITSLGKKNNSAITDVMAYQTELSRISALGLKGVTDASVRVRTSTLNSFMQSDVTQTTKYLKSEGAEITKIESASKLDPTVEKNLESATLRNAFDEELQSIIDKTTVNYKLALKKAINSVTSEKEKAILDIAVSNILIYENPL